jgi:hypothetical protein
MSNSISLFESCPIHNLIEEKEKQMNTKEAQDKLEELEHVFFDIHAKYLAALDAEKNAKERVDSAKVGEIEEEITKAAAAAYWAVCETDKAAEKLDDIRQLLLYEQQEVACARTLSNYSLKELLQAALEKVQNITQDEKEIPF